MRPLLYLLTFCCVMALAFWAYRENYATQYGMKEVNVLRADIAHLRESISVQKAEWAYLNRPMTPDQFGDLARVALYQAPPSDMSQMTVDMIELQTLTAPTEVGAPKP
jgi:hypothetical protein